MHRRMKKLLALGLFSLSASVAQATTVQLNDFVFSPASSLSVSAPSYSGQAGEFKGSLDGNAFTTFCADLLQSFNWSQSYSDYSVINGVSAWGAARATLLGQLMTFAISTNFITDAAHSAAIQAGIWEILYETTNTAPHSFATGDFQVSGGDPAATAALALIDWNAIAGISSTVDVSQLFSPNEQDFIVLSVRSITVPEPPAYALMLIALAALGFVTRRRSQR
jgi:PEP-CTERM motif